MDPPYTLINYMTSNVDACLVDYDIQCRCMIKEYFSNLWLVKSNVNTILGLVDLIQCFEKATIIYLVELKSTLTMLFILINLTEIEKIKAPKRGVNWVFKNSF